MALGSFDPADRGHLFLGTKPVVGKFADQFADGAQPDVDRRRGQPGRFERGPVALDRGLVEVVRGLRQAPGPEMFERLVVGPAGMRGNQAVEDQRFEVGPGVWGATEQKTGLRG